ncbi:MAG: hypothetical protein FWG68_04415 [Defluviitaleaceae bacterium]|nr:hypothetical protein [Defluviitaleaceae bacterium]
MEFLIQAFTRGFNTSSTATSGNACDILRCNDFCDVRCSNVCDINCTIVYPSLDDKIVSTAKVPIHCTSQTAAVPTDNIAI